MSHEMVTDASRLVAVVAEARRQPRVALDLEGNSFHRYPGQVCLVQLAFDDAAFLMDPIAVSDVGVLGEMLAAEAVEKVFHSADYDLRSLDREWGFPVRNLFDTSVAAAFTGMTGLGLAPVVSEVLGVTLDKSKRLQRADWTNRPLSAEAQFYAAEDVRHLLALRTALGERLRRLGREEWVAEECSILSRVRFQPRDPEWAFLRVKGSRDLDGQGLAVLKALHAFREREAIRLDRPPFKVLSDAALVGLADAPGTDPASVKGLGPYARPPGADGVREAAEEGLRAGPLRRPRGPRRDRVRAGGAEAATLLGRLKQWRVTLGQQLALDSALLWPMASLERLSRSPETLDAELDAPEVRRWQRQEFADSLRRLLAG